MTITIEQLKKLKNLNRFKWTTHILARLQERGINPSDIKNCIDTGEIIEQYPDDHPYPSCLVVGFCVNNDYLHAVIGIGSGYLWLITAYYPCLKRWEDNFKKRKAGAL